MPIKYTLTVPFKHTHDQYVNILTLALSDMSQCFTLVPSSRTSESTFLNTVPSNGKTLHEFHRVAAPHISAMLPPVVNTSSSRRRTQNNMVWTTGWKQQCTISKHFQFVPSSLMKCHNAGHARHLLSTASNTLFVIIQALISVHPHFFCEFRLHGCVSQLRASLKSVATYQRTKMRNLFNLAYANHEIRQLEYNFHLIVVTVQ